MGSFTSRPSGTSPPSGSLLGFAAGVRQALGFGPGATRPAASPGAELFEREVDLAVERGGGQAALDKRKAELSQTRRSGRRESFESYREGADRARDREASEPREAPAPAAELARPIQDSRSGIGASDAAGQGPRGDAAPSEAAEKSPGRTNTRGDRPSGDSAAPTTGGKGSTSGVTPPVAGAGGTGPTLVSGTAGAAVVEARPAGVTAPGAPPAPRSLTSTQGHRLPPTPLPPAPDTESIERAAEVLRQMRLKLSTAARGAGHEVTLQLAPMELGRLSIRMRLENGALSTVVRAESQGTLELLERQAPELRALLSQQGFDAERLELELFGGGDSPSPEGRSDWADPTDAQPAGGAPSDETRISDPVQSQPLRADVSEDGVDTYA